MSESILQYQRFDCEGIELVIDTTTGESFATERGYARMSGKSQSTINGRVNRMPEGERISSSKTAEIHTPGGIQGVRLIDEDTMVDWLGKDNPELLKQFAKLGIRASLHKMAGFEVTSTAVTPEPVPVFQPVTDDTVKIHIQGIKYLTDNGDLQLAQLLKVQFGNRLLAEQQNFLSPVEVAQYEGVIDVAIRLGFKVPANYESSLGTFVKKLCCDLMIGVNKRYSSASAKQIGATMYPAKHPRVEAAVKEYCIGKSFYHQDMDWIA